MGDTEKDSNKKTQLRKLQDEIKRLQKDIKDLGDSFTKPNLTTKGNKPVDKDKAKS
jgi:hypothetical protein